MIRSFRALTHVQAGFTRPEAVQTFPISIPESAVADGVAVVRMEQAIADNIAAIPGILHGLRLTIVGIGCGLGVAFALPRLMSSSLFEVRPNDPITCGAVSVDLIAAAALASYLPAARAASVDPIEALRAE
jgi:hypothetical protein